MPKTRMTIKNKKNLTITLLFGLLTLTGCATTSERPDTSLMAPEKSEWSTSSKADATAVINPKWWKGFQDPYLNKLVMLALNENSDLIIALARLNEAGTAIGEVKARSLPSFSAGVSPTFSAARNPMTNNYETTKQYSAKAGLNWEIDIWGKLKKGVEAKQSAYHASEAEWRATYLNTATQVASTYFLIRQFDAQIDIQQGSLDRAKRTLAIYNRQFDAGLVSSKEVYRQKAELNSLQRSFLDLKRERQISENALATLLGQPAGNLQVPVTNSALEIEDMPIPGGLPSDLLQRRPDILAAEHRVLEAHQLVGEARLAKLPTVSLTANAQGGGSLASVALNTFLKSLTFGLTPNINFPIFNPETKARIKRTEARTKTVEAQYRKTVLIAFREVEDALVNMSTRREQRKVLRAELEHLTKVSDQVRRQMNEGFATQLEVFEAERRLLNVKQATLNNRQQILSDTLTLYKAMGGGWTAEPVL